jgi:hypothetical protein
MPADPLSCISGLWAISSLGHLDPAEKVEDAHPKLWCALDEGKVIVFDASSWTIHQHCFKVGTSKVVSEAFGSSVWRQCEVERWAGDPTGEDTRRSTAS